MVYISQLHLTTVMLLTGRIKLVEKQGDKEVVVDESKEPAQTCYRGAAQEGQGNDHGLRGGEPATAHRCGGASCGCTCGSSGPRRRPGFDRIDDPGHRIRGRSEEIAASWPLTGRPSTGITQFCAGLWARV